MSLFITVVLLVWTGLHGYAFWRLLPVAASVRLPRRALWGLAAGCWLSFPASRLLRGSALGEGMESFATTWLGVLFLLCSCFLVLDVVTLGGWLLRAHTARLRIATAAAAVAFSLFAFLQGNRSPVVQEQEVVLAGLPRERDGLRLMFVSDTHLGSRIGVSWINKLVSQADALKPDLIALGGDVIDHDVSRVRPMLPELRRLRAPLGVWAVLGNHDVYGGAKASARLLEEAGFRVLRDDSALAVPGLRIAGVDDLGVRERSAAVAPAIQRSLSQLQRGREASVLLSHTPVGMTEAAGAGAGLMLCGHTHGGQIWPFNHLVARRYPTIEGRYAFPPMTLIVSRGAGTWGPRMRLWKPGELHLITLRSP